jgi:hypothetical protein
MAFWEGGEAIMELIRWIASVFMEINEGVINAVVKGKLSVGEHRV